jgi:MinD-like ATPase involved in chromosome partitioning or flagellar assembly
MARYDETTGHGQGLFTDTEAGPDESWPDAPEPSWLSGPPDDDALDGPELPYDDLSDTQSIPTFDLGAGTESVVVDLTSSVPSVTPPPPAAAMTPTPMEEYASEIGLDLEPDVLPDAVPDFGDDPAPAFSRHAAPAPAYTQYARPDDSKDWNIPPVPEGTGRQDAESLTAASVLRARRARPQTGWRKRVLTLTGGKVNLGLSPEDRRRADLLERARTPVRGSHRVAVISLKGGVGKTTTTAALGSMFANLRGDRVIAVDANPDRGTLGERIVRESGATIRHLLEARDRVTRYGDVRAFTSQSPTRLEVLASDTDPSASSALSEQDYIDTLDTLERFYNLVLTDCGTGLLHDAMRGVLGLANSLVVVSSASLDGARSASATLDWLEAHGLDDLARNAVVVISSVRPGGGIVDVMQLEDHFASRCRAVITIPYDTHLEAGSALDLDELDEETLEAYQELAAAVGEGFAVEA